MDLSGVWTEPRFTELSLGQFAAVFGVLTLAAFLFSPNRRRIMGSGGFILAQAASIAVPLFGVIVVRTAFRHGFLDEGRGMWESLWLSGAWMAAFILVGQFAVTRLPPTAWWLRDLRRAGREMWAGRFRRWFGERPALERPI
jgi:hypothetical protein